jgi:hypothetical protein
LPPSAPTTSRAHSSVPSPNPHDRRIAAFQRIESSVESDQRRLEVAEPHRAPAPARTPRRWWARRSTPVAYASKVSRIAAVARTTMLDRAGPRGVDAIPHGDLLQRHRRRGDGMTIRRRMGYRSRAACHCARADQRDAQALLREAERATHSCNARAATATSNVVESLIAAEGKWDRTCNAPRAPHGARSAFRGLSRLCGTTRMKAVARTLEVGDQNESDRHDHREHHQQSAFRAVFFDP